MKRFIADFHIHTRFSRATSREMTLENIARWARLKGVDLMGTGDFTHPAYFSELRSKLEEAEKGLYRLKEGERTVRFILTTEVCNIFDQGKRRNRRIHTLIFAPDLETVERINRTLSRYGELQQDGRPTFTFPVKDLVKMILDCSERCLLIPAHAWTPWYSVFGANSGFDSLEECFEEEAKNIHAIETGLSSNPQMNWRLSALDRITLISNSDAHSPNRIGREANVFSCEMNYDEITRVIREKDPRGFLFTIEFFPEEGKYHFDGHRSCGVLFSPKETKEHNYLCPVCGKRLTVGVMHRVEELADRPEGYVPAGAIPAIHLVPLDEIIAEALGVGREAKGVEREYMRLVEAAGSEFAVLLDLPSEELRRLAPARVFEGIMRVRRGELKIVPGHDGVYGKIQIFPEQHETETPQERVQMSLF
ncbi:MAG: DNA helicase UvrD [Deltaproteobacteria bacterium]|nr:MAG: DNA helicase UvrD [Deltaproteobacteria bacterium]